MLEKAIYNLLVRVIMLDSCFIFVFFLCQLFFCVSSDCLHNIQLKTLSKYTQHDAQC